MRRHNPSKYQSHATAVGPPGRPAWWPLRLHDWAPHVLSVVVGLSKLFLLLLDDGAGFWRGECVRLFLRAVLCDAVAIAEGRERQRNVVQLERSLVIFRVMSCHTHPKGASAAARSSLLTNSLSRKAVMKTTCGPTQVVEHFSPRIVMSPAMLSFSAAAAEATAAQNRVAPWCWRARSPPGPKAR